MKKITRFYHLLTLFILLFGTSLFLWNCQGDSKIESNNFISISKVDASHLLTNLKVQSKIQQRNNFKTSNREEQNLIDELLNFTVIGEQAKHIEQNNYQSYTFSTKRRNSIEGIQENYFLNLQEDGSYREYLIWYFTDKENFINAEINPSLIVGKTMKIIDLGLLETSNDANMSSRDGDTITNLVNNLPGVGCYEIIMPEDCDCNGSYAITNKDCPSGGGIGTIEFGGPDITLTGGGTPSEGGNGGGNGSNSSSSNETIYTSITGTPFDTCLISNYDLFYQLSEANQKAIETFINENDCNEDTKGFVKLAIEALMDGDEVDFEDRIIIDSTFKDTSLECIHNKLNEGDNLYKRMISNFNSTNGNSITFAKGTTPNGTWAITRGHASNDRNFKITVKNIVDSSSNLHKLKILCHEMIHAYMFDALKDWGYMNFDSIGTPWLDVDALNCQNIPTGTTTVDLNSLSEEERFISVLCAIQHAGGITSDWSHEVFNTITFDMLVYRQELENLVFNQHDWDSESSVLVNILQNKFGTDWKRKTSEYLSWSGLNDTQEFADWAANNNIDSTIVNGKVVYPEFEDLIYNIDFRGKSDCN
ncbi:hypothetical protein LPB136_10355 [Tenacibaculum todarodis]|uniref:Uncharacterized protein n=1 Tax=Tenacibaculum todarodis TaxID=1850252 RepID=A0A1L3JKU1_9FLAO|nr:hypothetical protein [Tenacibaculum todarodis]APG65741.1 hypothetical protein LPB136_10355 [Tenacibaculum todarodis]